MQTLREGMPTGWYYHTIIRWQENPVLISECFLVS